MKQFLYLASFIFCGLMTQAQTTPTDITKLLKFTNDNYNMGKIAYGKSTEFNVTIQNISSHDIALDNVMVSCGCTTPKFTKGTVLKPGEQTAVTLGFNGSAMGNFSKNATLFFNGNLTKQVTFFGEGVQQ